ncbi:MAG: dTDP-4-dehydrorhamnose reductase [Thermomicrobiales bacterium]
MLVTGAGGQLGGYLRPELQNAGYTVLGLGSRSKAGVDLVADVPAIDDSRRALDGNAFDAVIHAVAFTDVDGCERGPDLARQMNQIGSRNIARIARERGAWLVGVSTDFVFDGEGGAPYGEDTYTEPVSEYGRSKMLGDIEIMEASRDFSIARTSWVSGGEGKHFPRTVLSTVARLGQMEVVDDEIGSPAFAGDLARALTLLLAKRPSGFFHLANAGSVSRFAFAREILRLAGLDPEVIQPTSTAAFLRKFPLTAKGPANSTLKKTQAAALGIQLSDWRQPLESYIPRLAREFAEKS